MATSDVVPRESTGGTGKQRVVNDMSIQVATVNGSGSQSSNTVLLRGNLPNGRAGFRQEHVPVEHRRACPPGTRFAPTRTATSDARRKSISWSR